MNKNTIIADLCSCQSTPFFDKKNMLFQYCMVAILCFRLDVTEGQVSVMTVYMVTALFGSSLWQAKVDFVIVFDPYE